MDILKSLEEGINVNSLFRYFAKTFNKVDYSVLLHLLRELRIYGKSAVCINSFLQNLRQKVIANRRVLEENMSLVGFHRG